MGARQRNEGIEFGVRVRLTHADSRIDTTIEGQVIDWDVHFETIRLAGMATDEFYVGLGGWRVEVLP